MSHVTAALKYAQDVIAGRVPAGGYVRKAAQRHLDDIAKAGKKPYPYRFDDAAAEKVCKFIELLPHTKGKWAAGGQTIKLQPWQQFILVVLFGWLRKKDGKRRFRTVYLEIPRKNGKSILAAGIGLYMLCMDGEFGAEVFSGATTEKQAWEVFKPAKLMLERTAALREFVGAEVWAKALVRPGDGSKFEPIIGNPGDGASPSCAIVDEFHEHDTPALYDTMETGMGAREQPLMLAITTAGYNVAGPCFEKRNELTKVLDGVVENDQLFGVIFGIDHDNHETIAQSSEVIQRLGELCNCGCAHVGKVGQFWRRAYAAAATTKQGGKPASLIPRGAQITRTDTSSTKASAAPATSNSFSTLTRSTAQSNSRSGSSGQSETEIGQEPQTNVGEPNSAKASTRGTRANADSPKGTELISLSTSVAIESSLASAESATSSKRLYALITATDQAQFAGCFASPAILESVSLETARLAYFEHSDTCEARKRVWQDESLQWVINEPPDDWADPKSLIKANPNFGVSVDADFLLAQQRAAMANPVQQNKFKTKHLNVWCSVLAGWMNMQQWTLAADTALDEDELIGQDCWIGLDLASKSDLCSEQRLYRRMSHDKPHFYLFGRYWLPEAAIEEPGPNHAHYVKWVKKGLLTQTDGATVDFMD